MTASLVAYALGHLAHVPNAQRAVSVCRRDGVTLHRKRDRRDGVLVAVERLGAEARAAVPERNSLVAGRRSDVVGVGLEAHRVHAVYVPAERLPAAADGQIPQLRRVIHRARGDELRAVGHVGDVPDGLSVLHERLCAPRGRKVPDLHGAVLGARRQLAAMRSEVDAREPPFVTVARHDELARVERPHLPHLVVAGSGHDRPRRMHRDRRHRCRVRIHRLAQTPARE
mmetsp:Transcript_7096/g.18382  ORF Transcript_7096/g.18382 Transcript_7096/m.18382 type:complete len:227 (-) Transcript_7096:942-1622(-)